MSSTARDRIFARLHAARTTVSPYVPQGGSWQAPCWTRPSASNC